MQFHQIGICIALHIDTSMECHMGLYNKDFLILENDFLISEIDIIKCQNDILITNYFLISEI